MKLRIVQTFFLCITILLFFFVHQKAFAGTRAAINIGPYWTSELKIAASSIGEGGSVNIMACPSDIPLLNETLEKAGHPKINLWIRGHWPDEPIDNKMAQNWGLALRALNTKYKVFFFPVNEPNGAQENDRTTTAVSPQEIAALPLNPSVVKNYTDALFKEFGGLIGNKVEIISPTIDPLASSDQEHNYIEALGRSYFDSFFGVSLSMYGEYHNGTLRENPGAKNGNFLSEPAFVSIMGAGANKVFIESGVLCVDANSFGVVYGNDPCGAKTAYQVIAEYFRTRANNPWGSNVFGPSLFSYNPDQKDFAGNRIKDDNAGWIYNSETLTVMRDFFTPETPPQPYSGGSDPKALEQLKAKIASGEIRGCSPNEQIVEVDSGDINQKVNLSFRATALLQAGDTLGDKTVRQQLANIVPSGAGVIPDFSKAANVLQNAIYPMMPVQYEVLTTKSQQTEEGKIGLRLDNGAASVTLKAAVVVPEREDKEENGIVTEGKTIAYPSSNARWAKKLRSLNRSFESITALGNLEKNTNNEINLREPNKELKPQGAIDATNQGNEMQNAFTNAFGEIVFDEKEIPFTVRLLADVLIGLGLVKKGGTTITKNGEYSQESPISIISQNLISDFTDANGEKPKKEGMNMLDANMPLQKKTTYDINSKHENPYTGPGGLSSITLVSNQAKSFSDAYGNYFCSSLPINAPLYEQNCKKDQLTPNTSDWALNGDQTPITVPFDTTPVGEAISKASQGKAPVCVLQAVKYIETGTGWNATNQCRINACSAAGPFQITVGIDGNGDRSCPGCGKLGYCPDAWPNNWPTNQSQPSPCDINESARVAIDLYRTKAEYWTKEVLGSTIPITESASIQSQKDAIILGGDSYYGSSVSVPRLGGCSYGEFVYKHCDPSYQCGGDRPRLK